MEVSGARMARWGTNTDPPIGRAPRSNTLDFLTQFLINCHKYLHMPSSTLCQHIQYFLLTKILPWGERDERVVRHACRLVPCRSFYATENDEVATWANKDKKRQLVIGDRWCVM